MNKRSLLLVFLLSINSCKKGNTENINANNNNWWRPKAGLTFDWNLKNINTNDLFDAQVVDVDAFETTAETVKSLHAQGKKVIAYVSVGTLEKNRPDSDLLGSGLIGKVYPEWPDEKWLDIRQISKLKPFFVSRFNMIKKKGFDAIEPDNLDGYNNDTGFNISLKETMLFCDYIIDLAHSFGLGIGQKNMPELTILYSKKFDWALIEDAFNQGWQKEMIPYINVNKPVFAVEYTDNIDQKQFEQVICPQSQLFKYNVILKNRMLDKWIYSCSK
jgi:endo-alpha-1,4-polygalactosaminidase (GH114 family)